MAINNTLPAAQSALNSKLSSSPFQFQGIPTGANKNMSSVAGTPVAPFAPMPTQPPGGMSTIPKTAPPTPVAPKPTPQPLATSTNSYANPNAGLISNMFGSSQGSPVTTQPANQNPYSAPTGSGLYGQLTTNLANTSQQGSPVTQGLIGATQGAAQGAYNTGSANLADSYQKAQEYQRQLLESQMNQSKSLAANAGNPIPLEFQQGRAQILNTQYGQQQAALGSALQGESNLANIGVTGQGQGINGLNSATGQANTAQQTQQNGLYNAAGLASPILGSYGQANYNPLGSQGAGAITSGSEMDTALNQYAQMAANGQISAIPSNITSNPILNAELNNRAKKINPSYNPVTSAAQGGVQTQQTQQVEAYRSAMQQGQNLQSQLKDLISTFGLNPSDVNAVNLGLQHIAQNTSDPHYKQLVNYVNDIANTYSQILTPPGGSATDTSRGIASSMLDATAAGNSIIDTMKSLDNAAQAKIAGIPTIGGNSSTGSGGSYTSSSGTTYKLPY